MVDRFFEGNTGTPDLLVQKMGDIVIQRESSSHILMLID